MKKSEPPMTSQQELLLESLSALMDGEASELELRRILKECKGDAELMSSWSRYHLISASIKKEVHSNPSVNLLQGINEQLANEPQVKLAPAASSKNEGNGSKGSLLRYLGQGAVAASVAIAVLFSAGTLTTQVADTSVSGAQISSSLPVLNGTYQNSEITRTVSFDAPARDRLQQVIMQEFSRELSEPALSDSYPTLLEVPLLDSSDAAALSEEETSQDQFFQE